MYVILFFLTIIVLIEIVFHPRLDYTWNGKLLLWYSGLKKRKYVILM